MLREFGDVDAGIGELRKALRLARRTGSRRREADVLASLAVALVWAGRTAAGLSTFDQALRLSRGAQAGRVLHRRSIALLALGRNVEALEDARRAAAMLRRTSDKLWTARAVGHRGLMYHTMGFPARADADIAAAERLFGETSQVLESIYMVHNRALIAYSINDIPAALSYFAEAASRYEPLHVLVPDLTVDRCLVLLAAGLARDALAEADGTVDEIERVHGQSTKKAELLLVAANCALAAAQPQAALDRAQAAHHMYRSQHNSWRLARTRLVLVQAKFATGQVSARLLREANWAAVRLEALGSGDAVQAHLLAGRVALELGRHAEADRHFSVAARSRRRGPAMSRASGWLGVALQAQAAGQPRQLFIACRRGLEVLDEHRFTLGASELRAQATAHGAELAVLAQRHAVRAHRPRLLLTWSERWRATALAVPPVRPSPDRELNVGLAKLRGVMRQLDKARHEGTPNVSAQRKQVRLERDRRRLEGLVRAHALRTRGTALPDRAVVSVPELLDQLGGTRLVEIVDIDGVVHVLVCGGGRVRQFTAGHTAEATKAAGFARFALRRLARSRPEDDLDSALAILNAAGPKLQDALLGPAARHLGDGAVVIVPPARLHAIPWMVVPALSDRAVSVVPSARAWLRARTAPPPSSRPVTLVCGPGLATGGAEVPVVSQLYDEVTVLTGGDATTEKVRYALDGAWLAHIAAHGIFRADSPLFSSLRMQDGPLTVYDFEQLHRAPYRLVLSACDSGVLAPAGADELLGLVSSLLPLGTAGIVAAVVPLNDYAVVPVMLSLHRSLRAGQTLAESIYSARCALTGDPIQEATAMSLLALGAA
ncbi:MAG TPA: CHAT domain-containing protein [Streptosporangiaceae bacterium]|nr:CHAT domain-containing protein [Streptosporangiaceae bacterium]